MVVVDRASPSPHLRHNDILGTHLGIWGINSRWKPGNQPPKSRYFRKVTGGMIKRVALPRKIKLAIKRPHFVRKEIAVMIGSSYNNKTCPE
ncbi:uncharacterized protein PGTG_21732 [Puccinia graminis f. sp. tritici CRL 75-36-700-3]|uniref:Uncharacterized protein n=1 Tax=Puccinia graminis f. sp. tritici (strain CRL 75-36-700-3 / race SCCL) TaxID=418459 RepID=H6QSN0_PUCGT|nr:uncharacterized protein PGTG_21732 [Puccinia graminis f. sp. tritici CRL 75-36-700-3]EHS63766.1 hypothetical protein PGTG_21732 [Puccinia graminis f. sp. tritici CRL 75-36-700-3]